MLRQSLSSHPLDHSAFLKADPEPVGSHRLVFKWVGVGSSSQRALPHTSACLRTCMWKRWWPSTHTSRTRRSQPGSCSSSPPPLRWESFYSSKRPRRDTLSQLWHRETLIYSSNMMVLVHHVVHEAGCLNHFTSLPWHRQFGFVQGAGSEAMRISCSQSILIPESLIPI